MPHSYKAISKHMARFFPNCPSSDRDAIIALVQSDQYRDIDLKTATAMSARVHVRNTQTDFDNLKQVDAMTRNEAILIVKEEVADIIQSWKK
ncbi:DUF2293 domain-containing protein [Hirschia baltica]|nr:DUF2293 domain-containing protein [Hirschia baltica]